MDLPELQQKLVRFGHDRDWAQFHSPKNLAMALAVEAGELLEHFQWLREDESCNLSGEKRRAVALEMADVFMYTALLAKKLDIDLMAAAEEKMALNDIRYPAELVRGSAKKHDEY